MLPLLQTHLHIQHHPDGLLQCLLLYNTNHLSCYSDDSTISHNKRSNYDQTTTITFPSVIASLLDSTSTPWLTSPTFTVLLF